MHLLIYYNMGSKSAIGIGNGICFKQVRDKGGGSYIDPLVRDSIVGLWKSDQNTNESPTRNIIKNTIKGKGGDLELLNFGYKLNSGYGGYIEDFSLFTLSNRFEYSEISNTKVTITAVLDNRIGIYHSVTEENSALYWNTFKIKVSGSTDDVYISYTTAKKNIRLYNGINTVVVPNELSWHSFSASKANTSCNITLEFVPLYEGALVTDGKDDMIVSQKTVQEMLGGSNVCTVVSMIHTISSANTSYEAAYTNCIIDIDSPNNIIRNNVGAIGKTGIYGYKCSNLNTQTTNTSIINNILGDRNDYGISAMGAFSSTSKFSVIGFGNGAGLSEVAVYWTFISNKVLTTDEINQIIGYFKLDKYVTPQVIYDVKRQGLTNDTPDSDWYLKDFSKNGFDMTLYNFAKKLDSGIGKYKVDFNTWIPQSYVADSAYTSNKLHVTNIKVGNAILYTRKGANAMKVKITGIQSFNLVYRYIAENDVWKELKVDRDGIYELPASTTTTKTYYTGFAVPYYTGDCDITIEQIPDYEGALVSDGIDDYGKAEGLPILKDYTVAADYARLSYGNIDSAIISKSYVAGNGAFGFNLASGQSPNNVSAISFGTGSAKIQADDNYRKIRYQSKYVNDGVTINAGNGIDGNEMWLSCLRENYNFSESALYSMLLFPYSLSEFLLERQLKKYKLGTLYPNMVEFRPIVKSNSEYQVIDYYIDNLPAVVGKYYPIDSNLRIAVVTKGVVDEVSSLIINGVSFGTPNVVNNKFTFNGTLSSKSPQKIDITIDEYIRYEDIVQPYPAIINLKQDGKTITWGDKLKVGSDIVFVESANLLPELYTVSDTRYNGVTLYPNTIIKVEKSMVFDNARTYLKANEPNCILSPNRLRIPNSSYKILGYIPDLTGKGNHGKLNNFAYTEDSGVAADGSIKFDGTDDHITIPTLAHGAKQVLMKVNLQSYDRYLYNQRNSWSQYLAIVSAGKTIAYEYSNKGGKTYIDGILNEYIIDKDLLNITHNITATNANIGVQYAPNIGTSFARGNFAQMALFDFMLFPEISSEEEIQELNDIVGIEGGYVERPEYYWDAYGKTNSDADRATIIDQVSKDPANALTANNFAFNEESGYVDNGLVSDGVDDNLKNTNMPVLTDYTWIMKRKRLDDKNEKTLLHKGDGYSKNAFLFEFTEGGQKTRSFGHDTTVVFPDLISYQSKNNYNGQTIESGDNVDGNVLHVFMGSNNYPRYTKAVFYKAMLYSKTIDQLSINMLKNLFERDELIDITNPIFKKKEL